MASINDTPRASTVSRIVFGLTGLSLIFLARELYNFNTGGLIFNNSDEVPCEKEEENHTVGVETNRGKHDIEIQANVTKLLPEEITKENDNSAINVDTKTEKGVKSQLQTSVNKLHCGCPAETCDWAAMQYKAKGRLRCSQRVNFLIKKYHISEESACRRASQESFSSCSAACNPDLCKNNIMDDQKTNDAEISVVETNREKHDIEIQANVTKLLPEEITKENDNSAINVETTTEKGVKSQMQTSMNKFNCGCPAETCDWAVMQYNTEGQYSCTKRVDFLIKKYHISEESACRHASQGSIPSCSAACNPDLCKNYIMDDQGTNDAEISVPLSVSNLTEYEIQKDEAMKPLLDETTKNNTCAYQYIFWSGFCNELMMFYALSISSDSCSQILVESINWKDQFNTNKWVRHDILWDVVHWNKHYPTLPRFVYHNESQFPDVSISQGKSSLSVNWKVPKTNAKQPRIFRNYGKSTSAMAIFAHYEKFIRGKDVSERNDADLIMTRGALQPHPGIRKIINDYKASFQMNEHKNLTSYMVFHARVEPDMQKHVVCKKDKVKNITDIIEIIYKRIREPPVTDVVIQFDRNILEREVKRNKKNILAVHNLNVINELIASGMWDGRVKVHEAGSSLAIKSQHPIYSKYSAIVGGIINFYLALEAKFFIGSPLSTYSTSLVKFRYFRNKKLNFFYKPEGLGWVTSPDHKALPPFLSC